MELTKDERLALLCAMDKKITPALKDAKAEARQAILEDCARTGNDRHAIRVGGEKVGEVGVSYNKPAPFIYVERMAEALEYLRELGLTEEMPKKGWESHFAKAGDRVICTDTGEFCDFLGWQGKTPKTASVRGCDPDDVSRAFRNALPGVSLAQLIEAGE